MEGAVRRRRLTSKRADSEVGPYTNTGIKLEFEEWLTSKKAGFGPSASLGIKKAGPTTTFIELQ